MTDEKETASKNEAGEQEKPVEKDWETKVAEIVAKTVEGFGITKNDAVFTPNSAVANARASENFVKKSTNYGKDYEFIPAKEILEFVKANKI